MSTDIDLSVAYPQAAGAYRRNRNLKGKPAHAAGSLLGRWHYRRAIIGTSIVADYRCGHSVAMNADRWPDGVRLSDIEPRFVCAACDRRGEDVRPDFNWNRSTVPAMGYRNTT
jgi:hypothetical protein